MSDRRWIVSNLDFEYALRFGERWTAPRAVVAQMAKWSWVLRLVEGWETAEPATGPAQGRWLVWGYTDALRTWVGEASGWPSADVVARVNSKVFSHRVAVELGVELPGVRLCRTVEEVEEAAADGVVLVKHPLGVSGRERIEVRGEWDERQRGFVVHCLAEGPVLVEPKVEVRREWCVQFELGEGVALVGVAELLTDVHGQHRGHLMHFGEVDEAWVSVARQAAERVHAAGYRGALGVDAFEGRLGGEWVVRPVSEINARMTFGRLAVELSRRVEGPSAWWHVSPRARPAVEVGDFESDAGVRRLPDWADPGGRSGSLVLVGRDEILRWLGDRHRL